MAERSLRAAVSFASRTAAVLAWAACPDGATGVPLPGMSTLITNAMASPRTPTALATGKLIRGRPLLCVPERMRVPPLLGSASVWTFGIIPGVEYAQSQQPLVKGVAGCRRTNRMHHAAPFWSGEQKVNRTKQMNSVLFALQISATGEAHTNGYKGVLNAFLDQSRTSGIARLIYLCYRISLLIPAGLL